jgi:hypothetical protein
MKKPANRIRFSMLTAELQTLPSKLVLTTPFPGIKGVVSSTAMAAGSRRFGQTSDIHSTLARVAVDAAAGK